MLELLEIMRRLRNPETGCPWDIKQDFSTIAPYTIEEAYEVADAIARDNMDDLKDELGDLLLQVVYHAQMASEQDSFGFDDVHRAICDKLVRRHPHVFASSGVTDVKQVREVWENEKHRERQDKGEHSLMDGVPAGMAELQRSVKLQKRAALARFDWPSAEPVLKKADEELLELKKAMDSGNHDEIEDELGDLLFTATNLARKLKIDPAAALRRSNAKFEKRFRALEEAAGGQDGLKALDLDQMESIWQSVKGHVDNVGGIRKEVAEDG